MSDTAPGPSTPQAVWHSETCDGTCALLDTDMERGLTSEEAASRLERVGANELRPAVKTPPWRMFVAQFNDFMIWVLFGAVLLSALEGQIPETVAILAILLLNGVLGFVQEYRAERAMDALKDMAAPTATVVRDGLEQEVRATELVPGDLIVLESGDRIPADGRVVSAAALRAEEASLTGESRTVPKHADPLTDPELPLGDRRNFVYAGTSISVGRGRVIVTGTGQSTEMGRIADMLAETEEEKTPLQVELQTVGKKIAVLVLGIAAVVFVVNVIQAGRALPGGLDGLLAAPVLTSVVTSALLIAVSLAVAAIPEGLPAIVTVTLSLGVRLMAQRNAVVRKLHAVETLGSTSFICTDKTGTLTRNEMVVRRMVVGSDLVDVLPDWAIQPHDHTPSAADRNLLLEIAASCNDAHFTAAGDLVGDPTETALIVAAGQLAEERIRPERVFEVPFDSERKMMTTVHRIDGHLVAYVKGAPDIVLSLCSGALLRGEDEPMTDELVARIENTNESLASTGYRTLAFAVRRLPEGYEPDATSLETDLTYVGLLGLVDPPRLEVPDAIAACHKAGIEVAMVTGDHALTARAIGHEIGLLDTPDAQVVSGVELERMTEDELYEAVEHIRIYARVSPQHKLRIVDALKRRGHVVAMTGDGVNDAPALKRADIGVAMGRIGTDVSREAADMVLADDNFATIVAAVERGRTVFDNLRKFILFLLSCNASEVLIVFIGSFLIAKPVLLPLQLLWNNLVTDGLPALALGVDPASTRVMERTPRAADEGILTKRTQAEILLQGTVITAGCLGVWAWGEFSPWTQHGYELGQTMLFTTMVIAQLMHSFNFRSRERSVFSANSLKNPWLIWAMGGSLVAHLAIVYVPALQKVFGTVPLGAQEWVAVLIAAFGIIVVLDIVKLVAARRARAAARA